MKAMAGNRETITKYKRLTKSRIGMDCFKTALKDILQELQQEDDFDLDEDSSNAKNYT